MAIFRLMIGTPSSLLLLLVVLVNACVNSASDIAPTMVDIADNNSNHDKLIEAMDMLKELGISTDSLCHPPTSSGFESLIPMCDVVNINNDINDSSALPSSPTTVGDTVTRFFQGPPRRSIFREERSLQEEAVSCAEGEGEEAHDTWFLVSHALGAFFCVCIAALAAGLTMGMLSLDPLLLLIKMRASSNLKEREHAASLLPIVKQHHLLLVTLLLLNSMANEALPLFLEVLVSPILAVILSVTFVLFFGEIIPSAIFTGPNKIALAAGMAPVVKTVMFLLYPIAFPIAKVLDIYLHDHGDDGDGGGSSGADLFSRGELSALVRIQYEERMATKQQRKKEKKECLVSLQHIGGLDFPSPTPAVSVDPAVTATIRAMKRESNRLQAPVPPPNMASRQSSDAAPSVHAAKRFGASIHVDEVTMVEGALAMKTKFAIDVFTPLHKVYGIPYTTKLSERNMVQIYSHGFSRVPVYDAIPNKPKDFHAIRGILMTRQLIVVNPNDERPVNTLPLLAPMCVSPKINLVDLLNLFQSGSSGHMALVCARPDKARDALLVQEPIPEAAGLMGLISIEDVLEALLQEQIYDETDRMEREAARIAKWTGRKWHNFVKRKKQARETPNATPTFGDVAVHVMVDEERGEHTPLIAGNVEEEKKKFLGLF